MKQVRGRTQPGCPALEALDIPAETRPDKLSVDQYAQLTRLLFGLP